MKVTVHNYTCRATLDIISRTRRLKVKVIIITTLQVNI